MASTSGAVAPELVGFLLGLFVWLIGLNSVIVSLSGFRFARHDHHRWVALLIDLSGKVYARQIERCRIFH